MCVHLRELERAYQDAFVFFIADCRVTAARELIMGGGMHWEVVSVWR